MENIFDNNRPIYIQLVEKIRMEIVSGRINKSDKLPSVRELALIYKVNPNTMQKALAELESEKIIFTERTNGKYVTDDSKLLSKIKDKLAAEKAGSYLKCMNDIGIDDKEALNYLQNFIKERNEK